VGSDKSFEYERDVGGNLILPVDEKGRYTKESVAILQSRLRESGFKCLGPWKSPSITSYSRKYLQADRKEYVDYHMVEQLRRCGIKPGEVRPANLYEPSGVFDRLAVYNHRDTPVNTSGDNYERAWTKAFKAFAKPRYKKELKPLTDVYSVMRALKPSKSAGICYEGPKGENFEKGFAREAEILAGSRRPNPCTAYVRTQAVGKTRLVWGYPLEMTILESRFARPIIEWCLEPGTVPNLPYAYTAPVLGAIVRNRIGGEGKDYNLDFSKFDSSIPKELILRAFTILSTYYTKDDRDRYGWKFIVDYFLNTPIVMPDGCLWSGKKEGIPSGSYFTQLVGSIVNYFLVNYALLEEGFDLNPRKILVLGDDSIFSVGRKISLPRIKAALKRDFGVLVNMEKTRFNEKWFLGANHKNIFRDRPFDEIVGKLICPESRIKRMAFYGWEAIKNRDVKKIFARGKEIINSAVRTYKSGFKLLDKRIPLDARRWRLMIYTWKDDSQLLGYETQLLERMGADKFRRYCELPITVQAWW